MNPGVYVAGRSLEGNAIARLGTHQFLVLVPEKEGPFTSDLRTLSDGTRAVVLGAYNIGGKLQSSLNASSDSSRLDGHLKKSKDSGVTLKKVDLSKSPFGKIDDAISALLRAHANYGVKQLKKPITYPVGLSGQLKSGCLNSNSWAQSIVETTLGKGAVDEDFPGLDTCRSNRIDSGYFK